MDIENLKPLLSVVAFAALLVLMRRSGCGAHKMVEHRHTHDELRGDASGETKDPVCGIAVDERNANAASEYRGQSFYFCSNSCVTDSSSHRTIRGRIFTQVRPVAMARR